MSVLDEIVADTRERVAARKAAVPQAELARAAARRTSARDRRSFREALTLERPGGISVIAEHKRSSPSAGAIRQGAALEEVLGAYERGGAAAVSILTEESRFGGSLEDLRVAREAVGLPILRKDFIVEDYQLHEAVAAGADAVLLIVAALEPEDLAELHQLAGMLELDALVEVHDGRELQLAEEIEASIIGVNNRDLATLEVDLERTFELLPRMPEGVVVVAESGFRERAELERLSAAGVHAVLIGERLMRADDIEAACRELTGAPPRSV
jgi:indole-3-glycerol phosphate synthase